jgi:hypothetical protein
MRKLHAHVAESAESDYTNLLALGDAPVAHRGVSCDAGAEQWSDSREVEVRWHPQDESLVDDDTLGVATVGDPTQMLVRKVVSVGHVRTELLEARLALGAGAVRVHHAADRREIAGLELGNCRADLGDSADDLVSGDAGVDCRQETAPLVAHLVKIGVTDAAEKDLDFYVVFGWIAPCDRGVGHRRCRTGRGVSFRVVHVANLDGR